MNIVFLDHASLGYDDIDFSVLRNPDANFLLYPFTNADQIIQRIRHAEIIISNKVVLNRQIISAAENLKLICVAATGTNNIDLMAAKELDVAVCNVRSYATSSVVQHVFMLISSLMTRLNLHQQVVKRGDWSRSKQFCILDYPFDELAGKTLGIIGYGELGQAVARVAKAFEMQVIISTRPRKNSQAETETETKTKTKTKSENGIERIEFRELLKITDIISLHCPLASNTENLINKETLSLMKQSALLINVARGGIVNEADLSVALENGIIAGAGIDVLSQEPPALDNPLIRLDLPNLIITPHIAWASMGARQRMVQQLVKNIDSYIHGDLLNKVV